MSLGVEHILIQTDELKIVGEQQEQVFQSLSQEETLHLVCGIGIDHITDVPYGRVASAGNLRTRARQNIKGYSTFGFMLTLY